MIVSEKELCKLFRLKSSRQIQPALKNKIEFLKNGIKLKDDELKSMVLRFRNDKTYNMDEVMEKYNVPMRFMLGAIRKNSISYFRLTDKRGSKCLFFESDLEKINTISVNYHPYANKRRLGNLVLSIAKPLLENKLLDKKGFDVFSMYYFDDMTYDDIAKNMEVSPERIRQISGVFQNKVLGAVRFLIAEHNAFKDLQIKYSELMHKHRILKETLTISKREEEIVSMPNHILATPVKDVFGERVCNCLLYGNPIETIGELIHYSQDELLKRRNFGKKSLDDVVFGLNKLGLKLK